MWGLLSDRWGCAEERGVPTIGVGDGGNELGMGKVGGGGGVDSEGDTINLMLLCLCEVQLLTAPHRFLLHLISSLLTCCGVYWLVCACLQGETPR